MEENRTKRWREKGRKEGKKQVNVMLDPDGAEALESLQEALPGWSYARIISRALSLAKEDPSRLDARVDGQIKGSIERLEDMMQDLAQRMGNMEYRIAAVSPSASPAAKDRPDYPLVGQPPEAESQTFVGRFDKTIDQSRVPEKVELDSTMPGKSRLYAGPFDDTMDDPVKVKAASPSPARAEGAPLEFDETLDQSVLHPSDPDPGAAEPSQSTKDLFQIPQNPDESYAEDFDSLEEDDLDLFATSVTQGDNDK
mgnify:CR=1 FL=1